MLIWAGAGILVLTAVAFFVIFAMKKPRTSLEDKTINHKLYRCIQNQHRVLTCQAFEENLSTYRKLLTRNPNDSQYIFWDIIVITTVDSNQKSTTEKLINILLTNGHIPMSNYIVIADPVGPKVGNGGALLNVLEILRRTFGMESLKTKKILLIQAGGYSQRLPSCTALGKLSMGIPVESKSHLCQMLEVALIYLMPFVTHMGPGVLHACSDLLVSFVSRGDWKMDKEGFTTFGIVCDLKEGVAHGVLDFEDREELWQRHLKIASNPNEPTVEIKKCTQFLHKISADRLREHKVVHCVKNGEKLDEYTYMDSNYYFCWKTAAKLLQFYDQIGHSIQVEVDAYGDFLKACTSNNKTDYIYDLGNSVATQNCTNGKKDLIEMRYLVNKALHGVPLHVVVMNIARYLHLGTTSEYLEHYVNSDIFLNNENGMKEKISIFSASPNIFVGIQSQQNEKNVRIMGDRYRLMQCLLIRTQNEKIILGTSTVVESSYIESGVKIGKNCLISCCYLASGTTIPDNSYLFSIAVSIPDRYTPNNIVKGYITAIFGINDVLKNSVPSDMWENLTYLDGQESLAETANKLFSDCTDRQLHYDKLFSEDNLAAKPKESKMVSLWDAKLFPVMKDIKESCNFAVKYLNSLHNMDETVNVIPTIPVGHINLSMADMIKYKDTDEIVDYMAKLKESIQKVVN